MSEELVKAPSKFNPDKNYTWSADVLLPLDGKTFELTINTLRAVLSTPENQRIIALYETLKAYETILVNGVETDLITEVKE
jgi:hypothetical protein